MTKARDLANASTALSAVSATELAFVDGVTSAIQTQLDAKAASSTAVTLTGTQTLTNKTLTNPVISSVINNTLTSTTGDMIYASAANTPARLGIGSTDQVLKVSGGVPTWATPAAASSGLTFISKTSFTNSSSIAVDNVFSSSYDNYQIVMNIDSGNYGYILFQWRYAGPTTAATTNYLGTGQGYDAPGNATVKGSNVTSSFSIGPQPDVSSKSLYNFFAGSVGNTTELPTLIGTGASDLGGSAWVFGGTYRQYDKNMTGFLITPATSSYTGHITVYGMAKS